MKLISFDEKKKRIKLKIETIDDLWVLFNIISEGDIVFAKTFRRVRQSDETIRSDKGERKPVYLGIRVEDVSFHGFSDRLRIKGKIISGPEELCKLGSYHTLNVDINQEVEIIKEEWPKIELERINEAIKTSLRPKVLICAVDSGEATIAIVGDFQTKILSRITESIPGKRVDSKEYSKAYTKFFNGILNSIDSTLQNFEINNIILAGPGFVKEHLYNFIIQKNPTLKGKIIIDNASSGDVSAITEVIKRGATTKAMAKLKAIEDAKDVDELLEHLAKQDEKAVYGINFVKKAADIGAVALLLLTDELLRIREVEQKKELYQLIENVERTRGKVKIISTQHPAGEILKGLGGIAAILRFKIS
ncbi:MAG: mRNA surveillance protein pelota [Candidatus Odinarchaeia archaeon]